MKKKDIALIADILGATQVSTGGISTAFGLRCSVCDYRWISNLDVNDPEADLLSSPILCPESDCEGLGYLA